MLNQQYRAVLPGPSNHMSAALGTKKWKTKWKKTELVENGNAVRKEEGHVRQMNKRSETRLSGKLKRLQSIFNF